MHAIIPFCFGEHENNKKYFWDLGTFGFTWFYNVFFVVFIVEPCHACNINFCFCEHKNNKKYFWDLGIFGFTLFYNVFFVVFIVEPCNACNIAFCFCEHKNNKVFLRLVYIFVYLILQCFLVFGFVVCVVSMFACVWVISLFIFMQKARKGRSQLGYAFKPFSRWIFVLPPFCGELLRGVLCCLNIIWECYSFCIFKFTRFLNEYFGGKWSYLGVPRKQNCLYCTLACTVVSSFCWNHAERHYLGHL